MELLLRVRVGSDLASDLASDVIAVVDPDHTVVDLTTALCDHLGTTRLGAMLSSERIGRILEPAAAVGACGVMSGDELVVGPARPGSGRPLPPSRAVTADLVAGPESGRSRLLQTGRLSIGRAGVVDLHVDDPSVSRHHADVDVDAAMRVVISPRPGVANGVTVNDVQIAAPTPVTSTDIIGLGGSRLAFRLFERSQHEHNDRLGQIDFHRTPYRPPILVERIADPVGPIPNRPEPRRLQILAVLVPLTAGLAMYAFTRQLQFLALTLISPIVMAAGTIEERRSGRRKFGDQLRTFRADLIAHRHRLELLRETERIERMRAAPDLADLVRRAELRTIDLWARGRTAPDFLRLRVGLGAAPVQFPIELEPGGAEDLRAEAWAAVRGLDVLANMPVSVDLCGDAVIGVHGERRLVGGVVSSMAIQAATLHSPDDLTIAAAVSADRRLEWLKWLPHLRSVTSPLSGGHLVTTTADTDAMIARLIELAVFRQGDQSLRSDEPHWPRLLLLLDCRLEPDPAEVSRLLDLAPAAGISVVWLAERAAQVPRQATRMLAVRRAVGAAMVGHLSSTNPALPDRHLEVEHLRRPIAERAARSLAPVRDASTASLATSIPRIAPLLDVLGVGNPTADWVGQRWRHATGSHLRFPIGIGAAGVVELDLVHDGPHTLIGGTSGSGKSELLQSMVAALAVNHPPTRLNFLFVDYKGGASTQLFERLPHTVGYVTNLSAELSLRALTSLRAELNRRMSAMEGRAKDLTELLAVAPDEAPASLVIIVDEFATLTKELPEFVEGVIDIAQRGRSLGIHLVLATQRPSGSVNENILANTNLRISLRMLDRAESTSILDSPDAADIPVPLRGRGFVRLGPHRLVEFQSAFGGAPLLGDETRQPVLVGSFVGTDDSPRSNRGERSASTPRPASHLSTLIDAVVEADRSAGHPMPRRPWREVLPEIVTLGELDVSEATGEAAIHVGRHVAIGLLDDPEHQDQRPGVVDLEQGGGLLVFGTGGSGKTTLLRTIAASLEQSSDDGSAATLVFDFASRGLVGLRALPTVVDVATGDDLEAVTRHLVMLDRELERRRLVLAEAGAEDLTAYLRDRPALPRIVVLIDGFGDLVSTLLEPAAGLDRSTPSWSDLVTRLVIDGRQVGIHTVITADRRSAVPSRLHSAVANRLVLRHADEGSYGEHGVPPQRARGLDLVPGRGLLQGHTLIQVATVSADPLARAQVEAMAVLAAGSANQPTTVLASRTLPERIPIDQVGWPPRPLRRLQAVIGVFDVSGVPAAVDLEWSNLTIVGPPRSGRSTALAVLGAGLQGDHEVFVIGPSSSPLAALDVGTGGFGRTVPSVLDHLDARLTVDTPVAAGATDPRPLVLLIDDLDRIDDPQLGQRLDRLSASERLRVVGALESRSMIGYTTSALVTLLRRSRRQLVLQPHDPGEFLQSTGVKLPSRPGLRMPPGRGVLLTDRTPSIVQVGFVPTGDHGGDPAHPIGRPRLPGDLDRHVATQGAGAPSVSTQELSTCERQPARR
jgi:S-DNA-T family DNA segregation ATPase FtsK/SpoIIIE